jgi:hypothetical protein
LILIRTPKYEGILSPEEHGVSVSFDGNDGDEKGFLRAFKLNGNEAHVYTDTHHYSVGLRKVEQEELNLMRETIRKMNFDSSFQTEGV